MVVLLSLVALCSLPVLAPDAITAWLTFDREAILAGQFWRCWTGHLLHFSWQHAVADLALLFVATGILEQRAGSRAAALALLAGAPLISLGLLLLVADLQEYAGASAIATLTGVAAGCHLWRAHPRLKGVLGLLAMLALGKIIVDASGALPNFSTLPAGIQVAWQAHAMGAIVGVLLALLPEFQVAPGMKLAHPCRDG